MSGLPRPRAAAAEPVPPAQGTPEVLAEFGLPESAPWEQLRGLTRVAATLCGAPTAVINLLGECYQHQVGAHGFDGGDTPVEHSMCMLAVRLPRLRYVPDTREEPAFAGNPWVDGRLGDVRFYASAPVLVDGDRLLGSLCVFSDVPATLTEDQLTALQDLAAQAGALFEHVRAALQAREQEQVFRLLAESPTDLISRHSADGCTLWMSPSAQQLLGRPPQAYVGGPLLPAFHPDDQQAVADSHQRLLAGEATEVLVRIRHGDGGWVWLEVKAVPVRGADGTVTGTHCVSRDVTRRVAVERDLQASEARFRALFEDGPVGQFEASPDGRLLAVNPALCRLLGRTPADLLGHPTSTLLHPGDPERPEDHLQRLADSSTPSYAGERLAAHRDGSAVPVHVSGTVLRGEGGTPDRLVGTIVDLTAQVTAARELSEALTYAREIVDTAADAFVSMDDQGVIVDWNPQAQRVFGWTRDEAVGQALDALVVPAADRAGLARLLADGGSELSGRKTAVTAHTRDGGDIPVEMTLWPTRHAGSWRFHAFLSDITERRAAERDLAAAHAQLAARERFLDALLESADVGIVACDEDGRLTLFNRTSRHWYGEDVAASRPEDGTYTLYTPDGQTALRPEQGPLRRVLQEGSISGMEVVIAPKDSPRVRVLVHGTVINDAQGNRLGAVLALHDITELRARERDLEQRAEELAVARDDALAAARAKSAFLAALSHEIRTPLNGVLGMLDLLLLHPLDEEQHGRARVAQRSGRTLLALLNDVLDLSKAEAQHPVLRPRPVELCGLVHEVVDGLLGVAIGKDITVTAQVAAGVPGWVSADADRLRQVLLNLVGNAVKFTATGGVVLTASTDADRLRFQVHDSGPGIPAAEIERLFQPFEQGSAGIEHGGTGLGLALCRQLVEAMQGTVTLDSTVGTGTTATVLLPLVPAQPPSPELPAPRVEPAVGSAPMSVLLVDDSEVNRLVGSGLLQALGVAVRTASGGREAVAAVQHEHFDLVLMDCQMPDMDGMEATRALRGLPAPRGEVRVVALTGRTSDEDRRACRDAGMDDFLTKPVDPDDLAQALERARQPAGPRSDGRATTSGPPAPATAPPR